jgi:hypothetical protein
MERDVRVKAWSCCASYYMESSVDTRAEACRGESAPCCLESEEKDRQRTRAFNVHRLTLSESLSPSSRPGPASARVFYKHHAAAARGICCSVSLTAGAIPDVRIHHPAPPPPRDAPARAMALTTIQLTPGTACCRHIRVICLCGTYDLTSAWRLCSSRIRFVPSPCPHCVVPSLTLTSRRARHFVFNVR